MDDDLFGGGLSDSSDEEEEIQKKEDAPEVKVEQELDAKKESVDEEKPR